VEGGISISMDYLDSHHVQPFHPFRLMILPYHLNTKGNRW